MSLVAAIVATFAAVLLSGTMPSTAPGHLLLGVITIVFYLTAGSIAWLRLRALGLTMFRPLDRADVKVIALGVAALVVVKGATAVQLILMHQANHVQSGFEHFGVVSRVPAVTAMATALTLAGLVAIGPFVEELLFRGLLFGALIRPLGTAGAALLSALLFAAAHGDLVLFPSLAALGLITALAFAASRNLTVAVLLHVANNSVATLLLVAESFARH